ncbi:tetratricopeptide repeat protein [Roseiconus lacunae]|uniref:tetratricopeptide repeat protein n=1 Tax=Roseiconus lacunae TaxID=2605694 RepID=UPI001E515A2C|nr:tetratricopeptide repeat protein [Roseiconus lacunae]MCD0461443.1 tetratricopeptide repeat protein [Roseiconus lacunae]
MSSRTKRRNRLAATLTLSVALGCTGISGCTTGGGRVASNTPGNSGWMSAPKNVATSIAGGAKSAATKSRDTVASWFGKPDSMDPDVQEGDATDPTSLAHKAEVTSEVFVANGRLWESSNNFEKAMESYAKALEKNPNDPAALAHIARLHFRQNNHQKAAEFFDKAIKQNPNDAGLYNDLGLTLSKLGNHSAAASTIEQALKLSPGSSRYANNLASVRFEAGDSSGAFKVLAANNTPAVAHFNMAYLHHKRGQGSEASRHLNQALTYAPQAESDPATKRAVERSKQLLAQLERMPGATSPANGPAATTPATAVASLSDQATGPAAASPGGSVRPVSTNGQAIAGPTSMGQTASSGAVKVGPASYRMPAGPSASQASSPQQATAAPPAEAAKPTSADTPSASAKPVTTPSANPASVPSTSPQSSPAAPPEGGFALPPGFQMPQ